MKLDIAKFITKNEALSFLLSFSLAVLVYIILPTVEPTKRLIFAFGAACTTSLIIASVKSFSLLEKRKILFNISMTIVVVYYFFGIRHAEPKFFNSALFVIVLNHLIRPFMKGKEFRILPSAWFVLLAGFTSGIFVGDGAVIVQRIAPYLAPYLRPNEHIIENVFFAFLLILLVVLSIKAFYGDEWFGEFRDICIRNYRRFISPSWNVDRSHTPIIEEKQS